MARGAHAEAAGVAAVAGDCCVEIERRDDYLLHMHQKTHGKTP